MRRTSAAALMLAALLVAGPVTERAGADDGPVAVVGGHPITRGALDQRVAAKLIEIENERYEALKEGLDELVSDELLKLEAEAQKTTPADLEKKEIDDKVAVPGEADIATVYEQNKAQLGGQTLEQVKPRIVEYLKQQKVEERRVAYMGELKAKYKTEVKLRPPVIEVATAGRPEKGGGEKAPVTIIEFSDYECPFCGRGETVIEQVMKAYPTQVRLVFRDFPLPMHANARGAAEAASCANAQGKYWEYHAKLFANQTALGEDKLKVYAKDVGLDTAKFDECVAKKPFKDAIDKDMADGSKVGVTGTPAFFVNGRMLSGAQPFEKFKEVIDEELAGKKS